VAGTQIANIAKIPELKKRLLYTLGFLAIYRIGIFITTPGVNREAMKQYMQASAGTLFGMFNMFAGGALEQLSVFALGIMPYISASIILQLLAVVIPHLERLQKEGEVGRRKIIQYTRYGTVLLSIVQGTMMAFFLEGLKTNGGELVLSRWAQDHLWAFRFITVVSLTTGTAFIMWLGEQITERGIGNGISLIIFAGIVARFPDAVFQTYSYYQQDLLPPLKILLLLLLMFVVIGLVIFFERGQRRIPVQYAKRVVGRKLYAGQATHLPLKVNTAGVIPPIFASSILLFPATLTQLIDANWMQALQSELQPGRWLYNTAYVVLIIFFCYFYTAVVFNPVDVAENLKKYGGYIPGIRPGKKTAEYIDRVLSRITFGGAVYISAVCILPTILGRQFNVPFNFGGTAILIVVGVALDTVQQIEGYLITRHYDGFTGPKGPRIRGRAASRTV
jgi:preprotein translocase subunit SecY